MLDELNLVSIVPVVVRFKVKEMKLLLVIKIYLVPNLENLTMRVFVTNVSHLYETEIVGDLTVEKAIVAYKEENGQLVPEVKFED